MKKLKPILMVSIITVSLLLVVSLTMAGSVRARDQKGASLESHNQKASVVEGESLTRVTLGEPGKIEPLTGPASGNPMTLVFDFIYENQEVLGLTAADLADVVVTDQYVSEHTGVTHIYLRQRYNGIEILGANLNVNVAADGSILNLSSQFVGNLSEQVAGTAGLTAVEAVTAAANHLDLDLTETLVVAETIGGAEQAVVLSDGGISLEAIPAKLVYQFQKESIRLAWDVAIYELTAQHWWHLQVDAGTGEVLAQQDLVVHEDFLAQAEAAGHGDGAAVYTPANAPQATANEDTLAPDDYFVYPWPIESPNHTSPAPPADARILQTDPATTASPFGWHDIDGSRGHESQFTVGNNVDAYEDTNNSNTPTGGDAARADGGPTLFFSHTLDLTLPPINYVDASVTNLFYWNNILHDVWYEYGFDEASGNFQENNYGNGGLGSDSVYAEAQDGGGNCNANFATPPDGSNPRMQMYTCTNLSPARDGDLDNAVIVHEYTHGISNRLTGGPSTISCLNNSEQMGEGWSDWYGLMMTMEPGDAGFDARGIGTYLFGQSANGPGIRPAPYSTDFNINDFTYGNIPGQAIPHGVGFVWATMLWELTWDLIHNGVSHSGFDPDIYNGTGGNNLAMQLVTDGMKLQPCSPGFVDGRNAILMADIALTGGINQCVIWQSFARRGLGFSASQGSSDNINDGVEAFDIPLPCQYLEMVPSTMDICVGDTADYTVYAGLAYAPPVNMSISGHPAGTTATFTPNPILLVPSSTDLAINNTAGAAAGNYTLTITGTGLLLSTSTMAELSVYDMLPGATTLVSPADGAASVPTAPLFAWTAASQSSSYLLEVATDPGLGTMVYTATVAAPETTHMAAVHLAPDTEHFWRVTPQNPCGLSTPSSVFRFTTVAVICSTPNLAIPDNSQISDLINVPTNANITDLNISMDVDHTWIGDLAFTLEHVDTGTAVVLVDRPGLPAQDPTFGCNDNNLDNFILDDESINGAHDDFCPNADVTPAYPAGSAWEPIQLLSAFDGENLHGDWTLTIADNASGDTGTLESWCLIPTVELITYDIDLEKTVGTDASACAAEDSITLPFGGGEVTYCYQVTNTGAVTLTTHDLVDSELGILLDDFAYDLAPADSVFITTTTFISMTTVNTATWTATDGIETVFQGDVATVTVEVPGPQIAVKPTAVESIQAPDAQIMQTMLVLNVGSDQLTWAISETAAVQPSVLLVPTTGTNAHNPDTLTNYSREGVPFSSQAATRRESAAGLTPDGLTYYTDRGVFDGDYPGLPIEDFEEGNAGAGGVLGCDAPLDATTTGGTCFAVGDIEPGILFQDDVGPDAGGLVILGDGFNGNPDISLLANTFVDSFDIFFDPPVFAAGMDLQSHFNPDTVSITIYEADGTTVMAITTAASTNAGSFWGVTASTPIGRIKIDSSTDQAEGVDNIAFGGVSPMSCVHDDIPWITVSPTSDSTAGGRSDEVAVAFDSTGLSTGTYTSTLCIASNDADGDVVIVPLTLTIPAVINYGVAIAPDGALSGAPGTTVSYTLWVTNTGNVADVISLAVSGNIWPTTLSGSSITLNPGQSTFVRAWVDIPAGAAGGAVDVADVTAASTGDPSQSDTADLTTTAVTSYLDVAQASVSICVGDTADYLVNVGTAYAPPVNMSVSGQPAGTTAAFTPNPVVVVPGTTELSISNTSGAAVGSYTLTIMGTGSSSSAMTTVELAVYDVPPGTTMLVSPPDGVSSVPMAPTFAWAAASGASSYLLEVATDAGFGTIVYTALVDAPDTIHTAAASLAANTEHFWRVTPQNPCGASTASAVFRFTTADALCSTPNVAIPDNGQVGDTLNVPTSVNIADLGVSLDVTHTWVGDLIVTLEHDDTGTAVTLVDRPGLPTQNPIFGCNDNNLANFILDDESVNGPHDDFCANANVTPAYPAGSSWNPIQPLNAFDGENLSGGWTLTVSDQTGGDTGTLDNWCLIPATDPAGYGLTFEKTVGTNPAVCAATDSVVLPFGGGEVTYCYRVTNTGSTTLTTHDLFDSELGVLLDDFAYDLMPSGSVFITTTTYISVTTVNTAFWTATDGTETVFREDEATVTVAQPGPEIAVNPISIEAIQASDTQIMQTLTVMNVGAGELTWSLAEVAATPPFGTNLVEGEDNPAFGEPLWGGCAASDIPWVSVSPTSGSTAGGGEDEVAVTFDSTGLLAGTYTGMLCIASNDTDNNLVYVPLTLTIPAVSAYGVAIAPNDAQGDEPGSIVNYTLWVTNTGTVADVISLAVSGNIWPTTLSDSSVTLNPGASTAVTVWVDIPTGISPGTADVVTVTAISTGDLSQNDTVDLTTTAVTPTGTSGTVIYMPIVVTDS